MVQWVAFKTFVKRAWIWLKHYWHFPAMIIIGLVAWCMGRRESEGILQMFEASKESYRKEVDVLKRSHEEEIRKRDELVAKHSETLKKLEEEHMIKINELSSAERREIKEIVEEHKDDPAGLAKRIGNVFGIEYVE